jgi:hypothetical protein
MFDAASILIFALYLLLIDNDSHNILIFFYWFGIAALGAFIVWIPESPFYLFL